MKIIYLKGGLGNQMFQYAYGRSLELSGKKIILNISFFRGAKAKTDSARDFKLDKFNIRTKAEFSDKKNPAYALISKILAKLHLKESGYWQNEKYFKSIENDIRKEFTLKNPLPEKYSDITNRIANTESVSLHVRRGDYVNDKKTKAVHDVCGLDYYHKAIDAIKARTKNPTFFVFSDDIDWVSKNLPINPQACYVSSIEGKDYEELTLMSKCKHNIIANSSFSWWGAWLNNKPDKIVVAPKQWFTNKSSDEVGILPKTWIQI